MTFVERLADRAQEAEELRRLPAATVAEFRESGFADLLKPARYGGQQAEFKAILEPVREMAHGCASTAWTIGFYTLHNWMLALFDEQAQSDGFASRPFLASSPLAPTGRGTPATGGIRVSGRWSWATGVMDGNWTIVGALCGPDDGIYPALALVPADDIQIVDVWQTDGMRATGSNDIVIEDVFVPEHRLVTVRDIYSGTSPGAGLHDAVLYRWPMVPALALLAAMPAFGAAERVVDVFTERLSERMLAYGAGAQKDKPAAQARLGEARVRLQ
ncbi:MAG: acyl-CoA dehydrogenase family protein, partial [Mycobacterium sp.]